MPNYDEKKYSSFFKSNETLINNARKDLEKDYPDSYVFIAYNDVNDPTCRELRLAPPEGHEEVITGYFETGHLHYGYRFRVFSEGIIDFRGTVGGSNETHSDGAKDEKIEFGKYTRRYSWIRKDGTTRFKQNDHIDTRNWMSKIDGDRYLTAVTIPASHNSHAVKGTPTGYTHVGKVNLGPLMPAAVEFAKRAAECQDENIETQLKMGVRCIDLRYGPKGTLRHGQIGLPGDVSGVLQVISNFLNEYPQETVLVSAKWDTWTFISNDGVAEDEQSRNMVNDSFKSNPHFYQGTSNPQLKDCRGKIIRLRQGDQAENVGVTMTTTTQQSPAFHGQSFEEWQRSHPSQSWDKWKLESDWSGIEHALEWVFTRRNQPGNPDEEKVWDSTGLNRCVIEWNIKSLELPHVILPSDFANSYNRKLLEWLYKRCSAPSVYQLGSLNLDFVGNQGHDLVRQIIRTNFA